LKLCVDWRNPAARITAILSASSDVRHWATNWKSSKKS